MEQGGYWADKYIADWDAFRKLRMQMKVEGLVQITTLNAEAWCEAEFLQCFSTCEVRATTRTTAFKYSHILACQPVSSEKAII